MAITYPGFCVFIVILRWIHVESQVTDKGQPEGHTVPHAKQRVGIGLRRGRDRESDDLLESYASRHSIKTPFPPSPKPTAVELIQLDSKRKNNNISIISNSFIKLVVN